MPILTFEQWWKDGNLWSPKHEEHKKKFTDWCANLYCDYLNELKECDDADLNRILEIEKAHFERFPEAKEYSESKEVD